MTTFIIRRSLQSVVVLLLVSLMVFLTMRLLPGDPILMYMTMRDVEGSSQEQIDNIRKEFGLDKPVMVQYLRWVSGAVRGDLGTSILNRSSVSAELKRRVPITFYLTFLSLLLSVVVSIPLGVISAMRRGSWLDTLVTTVANMGVTVPVFWLGILLVYVFGLILKWLPVFGYTSPFTNFWVSLKQVVMPVFCLAVFSIASSMRQTRSSMLEVIRQDYIRTARAKGLKERVIVMRHALKNAMIPVVTLTGMTVRYLFGGAVLVETVFNIPGMGRMTVDGILAQDYPVVQGAVLVIAVTILLSNLIVDLSYGWLDPRIRYD
ncbi:MAG TPA: ABC transporter permease [Syntrophorhabdaceae bacterium]|nr:ABC transporter permease [Syntrophorhabdaceae bacterium]